MRISKKAIAAAAALVLAAGGAVYVASSAGAATSSTGAGATVTSSVPNNSVGTNQIVDGGVGYPDLAVNSVASSRIQNYGVAYLDLAANSVASSKIQNGGVTEEDLSAAARAKLNDKAGRVSGLEADGPYPGATKLQDYQGQGSNSTEAVPGDEGAASHTVWVKCAEGKVALGGGFTLAADASLAAKKAVQVVASEAMGEAIAGDPAGSILPIGWQVEVINNGTAPVTVRPWVTCAKIG